MRRTLIRASVTMMVTGLMVSVPCLAQFGGMGGMMGQIVQPGHVTVLTVGGNQITGMLADQKWKIKTDELGTLEISSKTIESVEFDGDLGDMITTRQNSILRGHITLEAIEIDSEFGPLSIDRSRVRTITASPLLMGGMGGTGPAFTTPVTVEPKEEKVDSDEPRTKN